MTLVTLQSTSSDERRVVASTLERNALLRRRREQRQLPGRLACSHPVDAPTDGWGARARARECLVPPERFSAGEHTLPDLLCFGYSAASALCARAGLLTKRNFGPGAWFDSERRGPRVPFLSAFRFFLRYQS